MYPSSVKYRLIGSNTFLQRETETLSALSQGLQSLRVSGAQHRHNILRLEIKVQDLDRQLALAVTQKRAAEATLQSAVTKNRTLREEMAKLKVTVSQIRGQCANDIRKRDGEISRLKKHLESRRGREGGTGQVGVVVITSGMKTGLGSINGSTNNSEVQSPDASLRHDTTNHLTEISQTLSNENNALIGLVKDTLSTLRKLQGLPSNGADTLQRIQDPHVFISPQTSYENLATNMNDVLQHLRGLLTNPSFVPLEEVQIREEEIVRLREGWEKIEARWREALTMMDGWRKRIMETGDTINLDDLRKGLTLAVDSPIGTNEQTSNISILQDPSHEQDENDITIIPEPSDESTFSEYDVFLHVDDGATEHSISRPSFEKTSPLKKEPGQKTLFPVPPILHPTSGNRRRSLSPRKVSFKASSPVNSPSEVPYVPGDEIPLLNFSNLPPSKGMSISSGLDSSEEVESLTVQQKLTKVEADAEEARKREESKKKEVGKTGLPVPKLKPGRSSRRTLSPEELEDLLGFA